MGYKRAGINDIDILTQLRLESLRTTNRLAADTDLSKVAEETRRYYETRFEQDQHAAWLVYDRDCAIAAGGISFYQVMPTYHNPTGERACIMNMYVHPDYPNPLPATMRSCFSCYRSCEKAPFHIFNISSFYKKSNRIRL